MATRHTQIDTLITPARGSVPEMRSEYQRSSVAELFIPATCMSGDKTKSL
jgi:hypothetical protein